MKILITGASSFTGYWFCKELAAKGHQLTAAITAPREKYEGLKKERLDQLAARVEIIPGCSFGDEQFLTLLDRNYDIICHHGAQVTNYKSPDFDIAAALHQNTLQTRLVMEKMRQNGTARLIVTGSVFEANEGIGNDPLVAFSPYGLSKTISWEIFRYWSWKLGMPLTKFIIPNPFGPYEEPRFCSFLIRSWKKGETPTVQTPDYIRDNIHVDLLAKHYAYLVEKSGNHKNITEIESGLNAAPIEKYGPSGYIESQGAFAIRFAAEMNKRLPFPCNVNLGRQTAFDEPMIRTNSMLPNTPDTNDIIRDWNEQQAWDELANYYLK